MIMSLFVVMPHTAGAADGDVPSDMEDPIKIGTAGELLDFVNNTKKYDPALGQDVILTNDIDVSGYDAQIRIGDEDDNRGYHGIFDGQGHKITGLKYTAENSEDAGLFAYTTNGAVIRNLVIEGANIKSALRGGVVVGNAVGTEIYNVSVRNSNIELFSNGSVITLVTNLGMRGGVIAGDMSNSVMYNCESVNSTAFVESVGGVQALGGDGIILGGLAGVVSNSTIEYSRVIGGQVNLDYRVAVGALNVKMIYAGGMAGEVKSGANIIDCYSTADVYGQAEVYVSVGAGADGCVGGIVGYAPENGYKIERCHFAGTLRSRLVNSILALPVVVMNDFYLNGILGRNSNGSNNVVNCYYDWETTRSKLVKSNAEITAVEDTGDTASFSSVSHSQYTDTSFWSGKDFDFNGTTPRHTASDAIVGAKHTNRWVMDYSTGMPVHGKGVTAATDFPGAGMVTIGAEGYRDAVSTDSGNVTQITDANDETVTLTAAEKTGYVFNGWFAGTIDENGVGVKGGGDRLSKELTYEAPAEDNAIYVADYQAVVTYRDANSMAEYTRQTYDYNGALQLADPPSVNGQTFYGWSTEPGPHLDQNAAELEGLRDTIVRNGTPVTGPITVYPVYFGAGANIKVVFQETGTTNLSNGEGAVLSTVSATDESGRWYITYGGDEPEGYLFDGWYQIPADQFDGSKYDNGAVDLSNAYPVSREKQYYVDEDYYTQDCYYVAKFKYKVTAWVPEEEKELSSVSYFRYGTNKPYAEIYADYNESADSVKTRLGNPSVGKTDENDVNFVKWTDSGVNKSYKYSTGSLTVFGDESLNSLLERCEEYMANITKPIELFALFSGLNYSDVTCITYSDFPCAAEMQWEYRPPVWHLIGDEEPAELDINVSMHDHYNFVGLWQYGNEDGDHYSTNSLSWNNANATWNATWNIVDKDEKFKSYDQEYVLLKASANLDFHDKTGAVISTTDTSDYSNPEGWADTTTATRKYQSLLFGTPDREVILEKFEPSIVDRAVPVGLGVAPAADGSSTGTLNEDGSEKNMYVDNYKFLGWVDKERFRDGGIDEGYLYDYKHETPEDGTAAAESVNSDYITTDSKKADGYILNENDRVYAYMDIHPVYAKYKVNITTNLDDAELEDRPDPEYTVDQDGNIEVTPNGSGTVTVDKIVLVDEDGNEIELTDQGDGTYRPADENVKLDVDEKYTVNITYGYDVTVTYHTGAEPSPTDPKRNGETLGGKVNTEMPVLTGIAGVFVGWTEQQPSDEQKYVTYVKDGNDATVLVTSETIITKDTDLWPVYAMIDHSSNLDTLKNKTYTSLSDSVLTAQDLSGSGYAFGGWNMVTVGEDGTETKELVSADLSYSVSKEQAMNAIGFIAEYKPVITYMIPSVGGDKTTVTYPNEKKYTESVELGLKITKGIENTSGTAASNVMASIEGSNYLNFLGWTTDTNPTENSELYDGIVNGPITLYPVLSTDAPAGMHRVEFKYYAYDQESKSWSKTTTVASMPNGYKFTMPNPGNYTDEDGTEQLFVNWSYGTGDTTNTINAGGEYTVTADVTFTAVYTEEPQTTQYTVYSNWDDASRMQVTFASNVFPDESALTGLQRETGEGITFIGYALVTLKDDVSRINDGLYAAGDALPKNIETYGGANAEKGKRIYAVWAQIDTAKGASLRLTWENGADTSGMRVMGYVNTEILERVGLNTPDVDYKRGMGFTNKENGFEQAENVQDIKATSMEWHGNRYRTMFEDGFTSADGVNAFSIIAQLTDEQYELPLSFRAWLRFTYANEETKTAYGTFDAEANNRTISNVALIYLDDLKKQNDNAYPSEANNWYGLGKPAYDKLAAYAGQDTTVPATE